VQPVQRVQVEKLEQVGERQPLDVLHAEERRFGSVMSREGPPRRCRRRLGALAARLQLRALRDALDDVVEPRLRTNSSRGPSARPCVLSPSNASLQ
jgi:hypothetical protein